MQQNFDLNFAICNLFAAMGSRENIIINAGPIEHSIIENSINVTPKEIKASSSTNVEALDVQKRGKIFVKS